MNFKCGLNLGAARERVRVAHALEGLPKIAASMGRGELSYSKVRGYRRAQEAKELSREAQQQMNRSVNYWFEDDGSLVLKARLPALAGAMLVRALDAALEYQVVVHVDAEVLRERTPGRCEIDHGPSVPAETARRLACDSSLLSVLENEHGEPLNVGRKTRSIPPPPFGVRSTRATPVAVFPAAPTNVTSTPIMSSTGPTARRSMKSTARAKLPMPNWTLRSTKTPPPPAGAAHAPGPVQS